MARPTRSKASKQTTDGGPLAPPAPAGKGRGGRKKNAGEAAAKTAVHEDVGRDINEGMEIDDFEEGEVRDGVDVTMRMDCERDEFGDEGMAEKKMEESCEKVDVQVGVETCTTAEETADTEMKMDGNEGASCVEMEAETGVQGTDDMASLPETMNKDSNMVGIKKSNVSSPIDYADNEEEKSGDASTGPSELSEMVTSTHVGSPSPMPFMPPLPAARGKKAKATKPNPTLAAVVVTNKPKSAAEDEHVPEDDDEMEADNMLLSKPKARGRPKRAAAAKAAEKDYDEEMSEAADEKPAPPAKKTRAPRGKKAAPKPQYDDGSNDELQEPAPKPAAKGRGKKRDVQAQQEQDGEDAAPAATKKAKATRAARGTAAVSKGKGKAAPNTPPKPNSMTISAEEAVALANDVVKSITEAQWKKISANLGNVEGKVRNYETCKKIVHKCIAGKSAASPKRGAAAKAAAAAASLSDDAEDIGGGDEGEAESDIDA